MRLSPPSSPPDDISTYWTDEEVCKILEKKARGFSLPDNVYADLNPYEYPLEHLPGGIWYFRQSAEGKNAKDGFWKAKGEACMVYDNSHITGWRTTFEFYKGQAPHGYKTDWVMQEYWITQKGMHKNKRPKDSSSLCSIFCSSGQNPGNEMQQNVVGADLASGNCIPSMLSVVPSEEKSKTQQGSTSKSQVNCGDDQAKSLSETERHLNHPVENLPDGDFLELLDLINESPSFSSVDSSCVSISSDEFDAIALLHELDSENNEALQQKNADCKLSVLASVRPNQVVMRPAPAGSLTSGNINKSPAGAHSLPGSAIEKRPHDEKAKLAIVTNETDDKGSSSKSHLVAASSISHKAALDGERETDGKKKKLWRNYFCFLPF